MTELRAHDHDGFMLPEEARRAVAMLATHSPSEWYDYMNLSSAFFVLGDTERAYDYAREALAARRNSATLLNLAVIYEAEGDFQSAFDCSEEAYFRDPTDPIAACHFSDALLRVGRFQEAWPIYTWSHETRWNGLSKIIPMWDGRASLKDKRIAVLAFGGYGDQILHLRWIPRLSELGARVTFMCAPPLHSLLADLPYIHSLVSNVDLLEHDFYISLSALAGAFCPFPEQIPPAPYLPSRNLYPTGRRRYGICSRAGEESFPRRHRSLSDSQISRIVEAGWRNSIGWVDLNFPQGTSWKETADLLDTLDCVITVDTGVAHLAGAMGIPTWVILPAISAAYYGLSGPRNLFYPSQHLFRSSREGIDSAVYKCAAALEGTWTTTATS